MAKKEKLLNKNDLSRKRRRKRKNKIILCVVAVFLALSGTVFLSRLPALNIKKIIINDTDRIEKGSIMKTVESKLQGRFAGIFPRNNFLIYPKDELEEAVRNLSGAVLSVKSQVDVDFNLVVNVSERFPYALWCDKNEKCFFMDDQGTIFSPINSGNNLLKYYGILESPPKNIQKTKSYGEKGFFVELSGFVEKTKDFGLVPLVVKISSKDEGRIYFDKNGYLIFLPYEKDKKILFENLKLFIDDAKSKNNGVLPSFEYIDARYGNKFFFKIKI